MIADCAAAALATAQRMKREANDIWTMWYWASVESAVTRRIGTRAPIRQTPQMIYERPKDSGYDVEPPAGRLLAFRQPA